MIQITNNIAETIRSSKKIDFSTFIIGHIIYSRFCCSSIENIAYKHK